MQYNASAFGLAVARLRVAKTYTQEQLAARAGLSRSHIALLESGKKSPKLRSVWSIADALGMKDSELLACVEAEMQK